MIARIYKKKKKSDDDTILIVLYDTRDVIFGSRKSRSYSNGFPQTADVLTHLLLSRPSPLSDVHAAYIYIHTCRYYSTAIENQRAASGVFCVG